MLSSVEDTVLMADTVGKCIVLSSKDYFACRPTEIPEKDVYMYESRYSPNDKDKSIKKLKSSKRFTPSLKVPPIYLFCPNKLTIERLSRSDG